MGRLHSAGLRGGDPVTGRPPMMTCGPGRESPGGAGLPSLSGACGVACELTLWASVLRRHLEGGARLRGHGGDATPASPACSRSGPRGLATQGQAPRTHLHTRCPPGPRAAGWHAPAPGGPGLPARVRAHGSSGAQAGSASSRWPVTGVQAGRALRTLTDLTVELQQGCEKRQETVPKLPGSLPKGGSPPVLPRRPALHKK